MTFVLKVDAPAWRAAQHRTLSRLPGLVPVVKGNGYGFGRDLLGAEATRLGVPTIAVGTYTEVADALRIFGGDVLVMEPYRSSIHASRADLGDPRLIHTITAYADLDDLREREPGARLVVEGLTSMTRFGVPISQVTTLAEEAGAEGVALHLPLGEGHVEEISRFVEAAPSTRRWYVSHVSQRELEQLHEHYPGRAFLPRVGTDLWLADRDAYEVRAHVLAVHRVAKGDRAGYRQRPLPDGYIVVVSGGTSHGVAMESPASAATPRSRAIAVAEGLLEAAHHVRSPFTVSGTTPRFAEPPHMQCSMLVLPWDVPPPAVGDTVRVRMRLTTTYVDEVVLT